MLGGYRQLLVIRACVAVQLLDAGKVPGTQTWSHDTGVCRRGKWAREMTDGQRDEMSFKVFVMVGGGQVL